MIKVVTTEPIFDSELVSYFSNVAEANLYIQWLLATEDISYTSDASISEVPGVVTDYVWLVTGVADPDYGYGSVWNVGIFRTFEGAHNAAERVNSVYEPENRVLVEIVQVKLDDF